MISKSELRVSNMVSVDIVVQFLHAEVSILEIEHSGVSVLLPPRGECIVSYQHLFPIRLTEEIILRCGFSKIDAIKYQLPKGFYLRQDFPFVSLYLANPNANDIYISTFNSLHQLQNTYYALIGSDFNIKK